MKARIDSQETLMKRLQPMLASQAQVDSSGLDAWRETPYSDARERAALAWTEALTRVADDHAPDAVFEEARKQFSEEDLVDLTLAVVAINAWNRIMIGFRAPAGTYQPQAKLASAARS